MKLFLSILLNIGLYPVFSQNTEAGLIYPESTNRFNTCCVHLPADGISLYDQPSGKIVATIEKGKADQNNEVHTVYIKRPQQHRELISHNALKMVGYEMFSLPYSIRKDGFVKVLSQYWISEQELEVESLIAFNYEEFLLQQSEILLGYYANPPGLNLRKGPSTDYEIITTLEGIHFRLH